MNLSRALRSPYATARRVIARRRRQGADPSAPAGGHELNYWLKRGIDKGTYIYGNYLRLFGLDSESLAGQAVCDFGSGPFGGVLSILPQSEGYPIDLLADEYNRLGVSRVPIVAVRDYRTSLRDSLCDVCFCTNALDHAPEPRRIVAEIARILKPGGALFLHVHQRRPDQLNKAHRYVVDEQIVRSWLADEFHEEALEKDLDWPNDEPELTMIYGRFTRSP